MYSADEIMCANALLSLRSNVNANQLGGLSDRALRYELRSQTKTKAKPKACVKVEEDECSRAERYERRCQEKAAVEKREVAKRWRQNVLPVLRQMR
jgi:hypothetical protein